MTEAACKPRRPIRFIVAVIAMVCVLAVVLPWQESVWDGRFKLNLSIHSRSSQDIQQVACAFAFDRELAEWLSRSENSEANSRFEAVQEFDGKTCFAYGPCAGRIWCGIEHRYIQAQFAILRIDYANGTRETTIVEIPLVRGPRSVSVEVP